MHRRQILGGMADAIVGATEKGRMPTMLNTPWRSRGTPVRDCVAPRDLTG